MVDIKLKVFSEKSQQGRISSKVHLPLRLYRLEKRKGAHLAGKILDASKSSYLVYGKTKWGYNYELLLSKKKGAFLPPPNRSYQRMMFAYSNGKACTKDV